jgi:hypothetical protein
MTPPRQEASAFYLDALERLSHSGIPFLIGGARALGYYTKIDRQTKDLDLFLRKADVGHALDLFRCAGYRTELTFPHWLAKVRCGDEYVDLIFSSGNGVALVDDVWFEHAIGADILGVGVRLSPPEEMIWSKAFVQERERFDGADVLHLFYRFGPTLDWQRLLGRFGPHWRVLFAHIVMFGFVYPGRKWTIPDWVTDDLISRFAAERDDHNDRVCNGTLLSREQYAYDLDALSYDDPRVEPRGPLTPREVDIWTAAIDREE